MKKRGVLKVLAVFLLLSIVTSSNCGKVFAITNDFNQFDNYNKNAALTGVTSLLISWMDALGGNILSILRTIAICMAVVLLMIIGIKYMLSTEPAMKAEVKKELPHFLMGSILLFGTAMILQLINVVVNSIQIS